MVLGGLGGPVLVSWWSVVPGGLGGDCGSLLLVVLGVLVALVVLVLVVSVVLVVLAVIVAL